MKNDVWKNSPFGEESMFHESWENDRVNQVTQISNSITPSIVSVESAILPTTFRRFLPGNQTIVRLSAEVKGNAKSVLFKYNDFTKHGNKVNVDKETNKYYCDLLIEINDKHVDTFVWIELIEDKTGKTTDVREIRFAVLDNQKIVDFEVSENKTTITPRKLDNSSSFYANCVDYPERNWWVEWFDREGHIIYIECKKYGFSVNGSLFVIAQAFREQATAGRNRGYRTHNWWNIGPVASRVPPQKAGEGGWATFSNVHEAVNAFIDRITSPSDLNAYKNPNHNPSFPEIGALLKNENLPDAQEINHGFRIGTGNFVFCSGDDCAKYGEEILNILNKYVVKYFEDFLNFKINCIKSKTFTDKHIELSQAELKYYKKILDNIKKRPK